VNARLCVCAIARNETLYLLEWIAYQRLLGADMVLIYDNGHDRAGNAILNALARRGIITHIPWFGSYPHGPQTPAYDDALRRLRDTTEWVLFVDLDEFVVPVHADNLIDVLCRADELDGMWFPWLIFGSSGEACYRPNPVIERFQWRQDVSDETVTPVKSAVRPRGTRVAHLHVHEICTDRYANPMGERDFLTTVDGRRRSAQLARGHDWVRVHHYMTKSRQEWREKVERGRADRGFADARSGRNLDEFTMWDQNEVFDDTALRFLPALRVEMRALERLLTLEPTTKRLMGA
jgi:hypothetical protein